MLNLAVPEEVAVVGVDNSETFCDLCNPPLSSVLPNAEKIGFEAAAMLNRLMNREKLEQSQILVPPRTVIVRQSSDILAIEDATIAATLRFIREHGYRGSRWSEGNAPAE